MGRRVHGELSSSTQIDNMKFLVLATCVAATAAQGFYGLQSHPNGAVTPIDEPAVAAARADHLATKFGGYAPGYAYGAGYGYGYDAGYGYAAVAPYAAAAAVPAVASYAAAPIHVPSLVAHPNGAVVPADEPAVAAARADHLAARDSAYAAAAPVIAAAPAVAAYAYDAAPAVAPVVAAAPAVAPYAYFGPLHIPTLVAHPNGAVTPADEPAVAAARADHLAAKGVYGGVYASAPYNYAAGYAPYAGLVAHPNGAVVPVDEPAVAAARADHLAAKGYAY